MRAPTSGRRSRSSPLVRFSELVAEALAEAREEIDALNVYPVPDGDTGTNLFLTFESADEALRDASTSRAEPRPPTGRTSRPTPGGCCWGRAATPA